MEKYERTILTSSWVNQYKIRKEGTQKQVTSRKKKKKPDKGYMIYDVIHDLYVTTYFYQGTGSLKMSNHPSVSSIVRESFILLFTRSSSVEFHDTLVYT